MDVLVRDGGVPDLIAVGNGFVLLVRITSNRLHSVVFLKESILQQQVIVLVIELVEGAKQERITMVMDLVPVDSCRLVVRVKVRDDVPKLDQVEEREGELPELGN